MSNDDLIDAEWEDVPDDRSPHQPTSMPQQKNKLTARSAPPGSDTASSPWQDRAFLHETVGTFFSVVGRIAVIALGLIVLFFLAIAWTDRNSSGASDFNDAAAAGQPLTEQSIDAEEMLAAWSMAVTGRLDTSGFALINGSGKPREFCNNADGDSLLKFGGEQVAGANVYDFYAEFHGTTNSGSIGAFWYDPSGRTLLTRNQAVLSSKGERGKSVPDLMHEFETDGRGRATIDGTAYHVCTL